MKKTRVRWQFNRRFRIQRTFPSKKQAIAYAAHVARLWRIKARLTAR